MLRLLNAIFDICLLRGGPQALPRSVSWTVLTALVYAGGYVWQLQATEASGHAMGRALLDTGLTAAVAAMLLYWRGFPERLVQTLFAFYATGCVLLLISTPLALTLDAGNGASMNSLPVLGLLGLLLWGLAITAHIYRHALNVSFGMGVLIAVAYFIGWFQLQATLFPPTA